MEDLTPEKGSRILSSENLVVLDSVLEDEGIKIDNDDMDQYQKLVDWLIRSADIVPSQARKYGQVLLDEGIASTERLQKKLQKDPQILIKLGIKEDDIEEIFISLQR